MDTIWSTCMLFQFHHLQKLHTQIILPFCFTWVTVFSCPMRYSNFKTDREGAFYIRKCEPSAVQCSAVQCTGGKTSSCSLELTKGRDNWEWPAVPLRVVLRKAAAALASMSQSAHSERCSRKNRIKRAAGTFWTHFHPNVSKWKSLTW
jgi:hypothetical protein